MYLAETEVQNGDCSAAATPLGQEGNDRKATEGPGKNEAAE
jgi:hypothetical protein